MAYQTVAGVRRRLALRFTSRRRWRLALTFGATVLVAAVAVGAVAVVAGPGRLLALVPSRDVAVPAADADPHTVVRAYLDALDAHDLDTARELLTPYHRAKIEQATGNWLTNLRSVRDVRLHPVEDGRQEWGLGRDYAYAVRVPARLDIRFFSDVPQGRDTPFQWGFLLVRNAASDPWRIADEGPV